MTEFLELAQKMVPLLVSLLVPVVGIVIKLRNDRQDPSAVRRMKQHAKLHEALPDAAKSEISALIATEAAIYAKDRLRKASRKVNNNTLIGFVFVAVLVSAGLYGLILWATIWSWAYIFAIAYGAFGFLLLLAGSFQLFSYDEANLPISAERTDEAELATSGKGA